MKGEKITKPETLKDHKVFLEGNATMLTQYWQETVGKKDIKIVYFGDQILNDIMATNELNMHLQSHGS